MKPAREEHADLDQKPFDRIRVDHEPVLSSKHWKSSITLWSVMLLARMFLMTTASQSKRLVNGPSDSIPHLRSGLPTGGRAQMCQYVGGGGGGATATGAPLGTTETTSHRLCRPCSL